MKKTLVTVACALTLVVSLSVLPSNVNIGPFGLDVVSAASETTPAPTKTSTTTKTSASSILRYGSKGEAVKALQTSLNNNGAKLKVDGIFGVKTLAAVKEFQKKNGLKVDGLVGPKTFEKLYPTPTTPVVTTPTTPVVTPPVDVVTAASVTDDAAVFEKSIGKDGKWIICTSKDLIIDHAIVLDGQFLNGKTDATTGLKTIQRKVALYTQDDKHVVTARFTLTAPKLTILSPKASIQHGIFKGDLYVSVPDFKLVDTKVEGNVYFTNKSAEATFDMDAASSITGKKELQLLPETVDAYASASIVTDNTAFEAAISSKGNWIACMLNNLTFTKDLVLDGDIKKAATDAAPQRKLAIYAHDKADSKITTSRFTLTAPKLTIKSANANITKGTFKGDLYVTVPNFKLVDAIIDGNVYFTTQEAKDTFKPDATSKITGVQELNEEGKTIVKIGKAEYAAHGTKCFTVAVVAMAGNKIASAYIDDYQFMAKATSIAVPNSDKDFGTANYKDETKVLASKRMNAAAYSENMKNSGGATLTVDQNFIAIQDFVKGKTIAELEAIATTNNTDPKVDAVSGATLVDTNGYLKAVVAAARAASKNTPFQVETASVGSLKVGKAEYAAHGTKCFTQSSVVMLGDKIVGAYLDDYQFMAKATSVAVPNSDKDFGTANYKDATKVLASKRMNAAAYSENMKNSGGATLTVDQNFGAVQAFVTGKTIAQLEEAVKTNSTDPKVDAVTGATLVDTNGYLNAFVGAAKAAK